MKQNLKDVTFIIPIKLESEHRRTNLRITLSYLQKHFDTNIIILESDKVSNEEYIQSICTDPITYIFDKDDSGVFHRTRYLNEMTKIATTPIIANYDIDVLFLPHQYMNAYLAIKESGFDMVYPYAGPFYDIKEKYFDLIETNNLESIDLKDCECLHHQSIGGAIFFNKTAYIEAGLENENFISWGYEDNERLLRLQKLGYKIARTDGNCYHLTHPRSENSWFTNPYIKTNESELKKVQEMDKETLKKYIETWKWIK